MESDRRKSEVKFPKTLVLDASYRAIHIIDWQDAMCLIFLEKAEVVLYYEDVMVRSSHESFKLPSILRVRCKRKRVQEYLTLTKMNIFKRDKFKCAYCGGYFTKKELTIDHIIPQSRDGEKKSWDNLVTACGTCNNKKADKTPEEANMPLLYPVYQPKWTPKNGLSIGSNYPQEWNDWIY